jgi:hypothetical protein
MKIHAIQTGTVAVTSAWREGVGHDYVEKEVAA